MCLDVGTTSSESGVDFPESFSTMGPKKHFKAMLKITQQIYVFLNNKLQVNLIYNKINIF